jgi:hypothetical protein
VRELTDRHVVSEIARRGRAIAGRRPGLRSSGIGGRAGGGGAGPSQLFVMNLVKAGVGKYDITKMGREVTGSLLMG